MKYSYVHACYVERLLTESEANLCWPSTSLVLLAPFVWLMSECDPEKKAHVTCVPQLWKQEVVYVAVPDPDSPDKAATYLNRLWPYTN